MGQMPSMGLMVTASLSYERIWLEIICRRVMTMMTLMRAMAWMVQEELRKKLAMMDSFYRCAEMRSMQLNARGSDIAGLQTAAVLTALQAFVGLATSGEYHERGVSLIRASKGMNSTMDPRRLMCEGVLYVTVHSNSTVTVMLNGAGNQ